MGIAVFAFAVAHSMRRHGSGPAWLAWLGYATALAEGVMSFGMFYPSGIPFGNATLGLLLGFVFFVVWMSLRVRHAHFAGQQAVGRPRRQ